MDKTLFYVSLITWKETHFQILAQIKRSSCCDRQRFVFYFFLLHEKKLAEKQHLVVDEEEIQNSALAQRKPFVLVLHGGAEQEQTAITQTSACFQSTCGRTNGGTKQKHL